MEKIINFLQNKIYPHIPPGLQNLGISCYGYLWHKRRFGGVFKEEFKKYSIRESYNSNQWQDFQTKELRKILIHAFQQVPYYHQTFKNAGFQLEDLAELELNEITKIPYLEKNDLRKHGTDILLANIKEKGGQFYASSGSTGTPTQILFSKAMHQRWSAAFEARVRSWAGVRIQNPRGMIGGRRVIPDGITKGPFYRYNIVEKQVYFSAYHISPLNAPNYVEAMWKYGIDYMTGYAVSNYLLALYIKQQKLKVPKLKAVITSSEKLTYEMRVVMEEVYQCKVYDGWSGVEACALVSECEYGSLHISEDVGIIEILDENGKEVADGEIGEVVCTGFLNYDQPLIRYRIGDRMAKGSGTCQCNRHMPLIQEIEGRLEDVVTGIDGRQMVRFHSIFVGIPSIERAQVIQHSIDIIEIVIQNEISLRDNEIQLIKARIISQLGKLKVIVSQHQKIEQTANGKFKAVISYVKK